MEVLRRGTSRMEAARGVKGQDGPCTPAPGVAPEGGSRAAGGAGCRGGLLFGYFLLVGAAIRRQEKVIRRKGERGELIQRIAWKINLSAFPQTPGL